MQSKKKKRSQNRKRMDGRLNVIYKKKQQTYKTMFDGCNKNTIELHVREYEILLQSLKILLKNVLIFLWVFAA